MKDVVLEIHELRQALDNALNFYPMNSSEVLRISTMLDEVILIYYKL